MWGRGGPIHARITWHVFYGDVSLLAPFCGFCVLRLRGKHLYLRSYLTAPQIQFKTAAALLLDVLVSESVTERGVSGSFWISSSGMVLVRELEQRRWRIGRGSPASL